jgi:hypothetical protein
MSANVTEWVNCTLELKESFTDSRYMFRLFSKTLSGAQYHIQWTLELRTV